MNSIERVFASLKRFVAGERERFMIARWNAKSSVDYKEVFPEELYRARLAALDGALTHVERHMTDCTDAVSVADLFLRGVKHLLARDGRDHLSFIGDVEKKASELSGPAVRPGKE